jgi:hypothetical protein
VKRGGSLSFLVGTISNVLVNKNTITTEVVSLNPVHGDVYSIQNYAIKFVGDL